MLPTISITIDLADRQQGKLLNNKSLLKREQSLKDLKLETTENVKISETKSMIVATVRVIINPKSHKYLIHM